MTIRRRRQRPVEVARSTPTLALIREGVRAGEQVVTDGYLRLREGTKVSLVPARSSAEQAASGALPAPSRGRWREQPPRSTARSAAMSLSALFISRPVATSLVMVAILAVRAAWRT